MLTRGFASQRKLSFYLLACLAFITTVQTNSPKAKQDSWTYGNEKQLRTAQLEQPDFLLRHIEPYLKNTKLLPRSLSSEDEKDDYIYLRSSKANNPSNIAVSPSIGLKSIRSNLHRAQQSPYDYSYPSLQTFIYQPNQQYPLSTFPFSKQQAILYHQPSVIYQQPPISYHQLPISYEQPQISNEQSSVSYEQLQDTYEQPTTSYKNPQISNQQPPDTYQQPATSYEQPQMSSQPPNYPATHESSPLQSTSSSSFTRGLPNMENLQLHSDSNQNNHQSGADIPKFNDQKSDFSPYEQVSDQEESISNKPERSFNQAGPSDIYEDFTKNGSDISRYQQNVDVVNEEPSLDGNNVSYDRIAIRNGLNEKSAEDPIGGSLEVDVASNFQGTFASNIGGSKGIDITTKDRGTVDVKLYTNFLNESTIGADIKGNVEGIIDGTVGGKDDNDTKGDISKDSFDGSFEADFTCKYSGKFGSKVKNTLHSSRTWNDNSVLDPIINEVDKEI